MDGIKLGKIRLDEVRLDGVRFEEFWLDEAGCDSLDIAARGRSSSEMLDLRERTPDFTGFGLGGATW